MRFLYDSNVFYGKKHNGSAAFLSQDESRAARRWNGEQGKVLC